MVMNLFVGNLNPETTITKLRPMFAEFGEVVSAKIIFDNATGMSRGFGFVEMADKFQAYDAIDNIDSTYLDGNIISVKEAKQNTAKPGQGGKPAFRPKPRPGGFGGGSSSGGGGYNRTGGGSSYNRPSGGSYNRPEGGGGSYNRPEGGGYNKPDGGYNKPDGGYNKPDGGYNNNRG